MKFWEAMKIVDEGGKVRRLNWTIFIQKVESRVYCMEKVHDGFYQTGEYIDTFISSFDLAASDWVEVVDGVKEATYTCMKCWHKWSQPYNTPCQCPNCHKS